jgi:RNA polymerase sigma-70 factor (ECF subfamily)
VLVLGIVIKYHSLEEPELLRLSMEDEDTESFDELVKRTERKLHLSMLAKSGNPELAGEICQQAFIKSWKNIKKFKCKSSFYTWIYRISHNLLIDHYRKVKRKKEQSFEERMESDPFFETKTPLIEKTAYDNLNNEELMKQVDMALEKLSEPHKTTFVLYEIERLSYKEIAKEMRCSLGTVMSRLFYARRQARKSLSKILELDKL